MMNTTTERAIHHGVRAGGFVRRHRPLSGRAKEWLHFCIATPELCALINFSISEHKEGGESARITCVVADDRWHGDVDTVAAERVRIRPGRIDLAFGESYVRLSDDGLLLVRVVMPRRKLSLDLSFKPASLPLLVNNVPAGSDAHIHWFVVPRLVATGEIRTGERCHLVEGVPAYHDHNWGTFGWGGDFAWIWGFAHPVAPESPWSLTFDRFMNRARTVDRARALMVWRDGREHRLFRDRDVVIESQGIRRGKPMLRVPRPLALLLSGSAADVPERFVIRARGRNDAVDVTVDVDDACQILVPDDHGTGLTVITEARCRVTMEGRVRGESVVLEGTGVFELLGS
jgi:hypothetical protein